MNETSPLQKQDLSHINYQLDEIVELLKKILDLLERVNPPHLEGGINRLVGGVWIWD